jgi:hypothetical protein
MPRALDSLDFVEVIMAVERQFRIDLPDHATAELHLGSAADLWRLVRRTQNGPTAPKDPPPNDPLWLKVRQLVARAHDRPWSEIDSETPLLPD